MAKGLYRIDISEYYYNLVSVFVAEESQIKAAIEEKLEFLFGEIAGKYSDVRCIFEEGDIELISTDSNIISFHENLPPIGLDIFGTYVSGNEILDEWEMIFSEYLEYKENGTLPINEWE